MKRFSSANKAPRALIRLCAVLFWIGAWWIAAEIVHMEVKLPSPARVAVRFLELSQTALFWKTAGISLLRIFAGLLAGIIVGTLTAILSARFVTADALLSPVISVVRATPVASFIILVLIWIRAGSVPSFIAFLMTVPVIWANVKTGIKNIGQAELEAARLYRLSFVKRLRALYIPSVLPHFSSACVTAAGLAWKAGIAAEVLCTPKNAIGTHLYESKLYLETVDLFAWTLLIILLSIALENLLRWLFRIYLKKSGTASNALL